MKKISVIIPVYNSEKYLFDCLNSILNQTYCNLQIILVDDGSTDMSGEICDNFALKDNRIVVLHKQNGGLSEARNQGVKLIEGDYVSFIDNDDILAPNFYDIMVSAAIENNAEIVECDFKRFENKDDFSFTSPMVSAQKKIYTAEEALRQFFQQNLVQMVWNKLYKAEIIGIISFEKQKMNEDEFWTYKIIGLANKIVKIDAVLYFYRQHSESMMGLEYKVKRLDGLDAFYERAQYISEKFPKLKDIAIKTFCFATLIHYQKINKYDYLDPHSLNRKYILKRMKKYNSIGYYKHWKIKEIFWFKFFLILPNLCVKFRNYLNIGV